MVPTLFDARRSLALSEVLLRRSRLLTRDGEVLVKVGDPVRPDDVVARTTQPAEPVVVLVGPAIGVVAKDITRLLRRWAGEPVQQGEVLAEKKGILGLGGRVCRSPVNGVVISGPHSGGEVVLGRPDEQVELLAGVSGRVVSLIPFRGVVIETAATVVQGVGGYGGEAFGGLHPIVDHPTDDIEPDRIGDQAAGMVLAGGSVGVNGLTKAARVGVSGLVVGTVTGEGYRWLLENRPALTVVVTQSGGAGMPPETFRLLERRIGMSAMINGTPGPEGPPEVVIALPGTLKAAAMPRPAFAEGAKVRVAAGRWSGRCGRIVALPSMPQRLPSGIASAVAELALEDGESITVARANLLLID